MKRIVELNISIFCQWYKKFFILIFILMKGLFDVLFAFFYSFMCVPYSLFYFIINKSRNLKKGSITLQICIMCFQHKGIKTIFDRHFPIVSIELVREIVRIFWFTSLFLYYYRLITILVIFSFKIYRTYEINSLLLNMVLEHDHSKATIPPWYLAIHSCLKSFLSCCL